MMSKKHPGLALVLAAALAAPAALAAAPTKVAVVDLNRVVAESPQGRAAIEKLNAERTDKQRELVSQQKDLRALEERLNRDGAIMAESERADVETRYRTLRQRIERRAAEIDEDLNARRQDELTRVQRVVLNEIRAFAKENQFDVVLGPGVVYAAPETDITEGVKKRLEAIAVAPAAAPAKPAPSTKK
jgi:outer membrane protein